jgi:hypothetical protein
VQRAVVFAASLATAVHGALAQVTPEPAPVLACNTWGHDVVVFNRSDEPIAAGTVLRWSVWDGKRKGEYTLEADLQPFIGLYLIMALEGSYWDLRPCEIHVVPSPGADALLREWQGDSAAGP